MISKLVARSLLCENKYKSTCSEKFINGARSQLSIIPSFYEAPFERIVRHFYKRLYRIMYANRIGHERNARTQAK